MSAMLSTWPLLAVGLLAALTGAAVAQDTPAPSYSTPLSAEEISNAHVCEVGTMIAICAGDKRIATGIVIANQMLGRSVVGTMFEHGDVVHHDEGIDDRISLSVLAWVRWQQTPESGVPAWGKTFYVITDRQLDQIIRNARRHPDWNPSE